MIGTVWRRGYCNTYTLRSSRFMFARLNSSHETLSFRRNQSAERYSLISYIGRASVVTIPPIRVPQRSSSEMRIRQMVHNQTKHDSFPVYLGVTLDRTLSYRQHLQKTAAKVKSRNNLSKLAGSSWGANADTLRTSALALCYSSKSMYIFCILFIHYMYLIWAPA